MKTKKIIDLFAEAGVLKKIKRSGWWMAGIPGEESVADHSFRCALMGYILAKMEKADAYKTTVMALFGDLPEARMNDLHKVASRYIDVRNAEKKIYNEQLKGLAPVMKKELLAIRREYDEQRTKESVVARDADILECLMQAKEYHDTGFKKAEKFFRKAPAHLRTKSAKNIWKAMKNRDTAAWWETLTHFER